MTLLRVLLMSIILIGSVQSFPTTIKDYEKVSTAELEAKETTDPISINTDDPQTALDRPVNLQGESSIVEFVFKSPKEGLSVQKGSTREKYNIANLPTKNEEEKLNLLDSSKENEIDIDRKDELYNLNITDISKSEDLLPEAQIERDQWLFDPQEMSAIMGGLPRYFYDAIKPIHPFPELSETVKSINPFPELSKTAKPIHHFPEISETSKTNQTLPELVERSYERSSYKSLELGGPLLYPKSVLIRDIDDSFYNF